MFVNTLLLWGLPIAAIPIIIHLFSLRRTKSIELSTFRFLFDTYLQQRRRMRLLEILLAALRTAFLLLFIFALARPKMYDWTGWFGSQGQQLVFLVDTSASMNAAAGGVSTLERAKDAVRQMVEKLSPDTRVSLIGVGGTPNEVFSRYRVGSESLEPKIEQLETGPTSANWLAAFQHIGQAGPSAIENGKVVVVTDCQSSSWVTARSHGLVSLFKEKTPVVVVDVGDANPPANRAVIGDAPEQQVAIVGLPVRLKPRVAYHASGEPTQVSVSVSMQNAEIARRQFTLRPTDSATGEVIYVPKESGRIDGRFEIPPDSFPADDSFLFTLNVQDRIRVLVINGAPSSDLLQNETLYLKTALSVAGFEVDERGQPIKPKRKINQTDDELNTLLALAKSIEIREINPWQFTPQNMVGVHVVILANCADLNDVQMQQLRTMIVGGSGCIIYPGERVSHDWYNQHMLPLSRAQTSQDKPRERLMNIELSQVKGDPEKAEDRQRVGTVNVTHPIFSMLADRDAQPLANAWVGRYFPIKLLRPSGTTSVLAELANGQPLLVESRLGSGIVLFWSTSATAKWNNLPLKPDYVPIVLRMIGYASRAMIPNLPSSVVVGNEAELRLTGGWQAPAGEISDPNGRKAKLEFRNQDQSSLAPITGLRQKGYYSIDLTGGTSDNPVNTKLGFAANLDPIESDFRRFGETDFQEWFPGLEAKWINAASEMGQMTGDFQDKNEFWSWLVTLAAMVVLGELFLCTWMGQTQTKTEETTTSRLWNLVIGRSFAKMTGADD